MKRKAKAIICSLFLIKANLAYSEEVLPRQRPLLEIASPTEWSFHKYIEQPIGLYRGAISVDIPLFTLEDGEVQIPIALRYNTSGIKVSEEASWVGLGWNLNVGGYITCSVVDGYDWRDDTFESSYKSLFYPPNSPYVYDHGQIPQTRDTWEEMVYLSPENESYHWGKLSPDVYYYSFPDGFGRYVVDYRDNSIIQLQRETALRIENGDSEEEFPSKTLTTTKGIKHEFDLAGVTNMLDNLVPQSISYTLNRTRYPSGAIVKYNYTTICYVDTLYSSSITGSLCQTNGDVDPAGYHDYSSLQHGKTFVNKNESVVSSIETSNYLVCFVTSARLDHPSLKKLDAIQIKNKQSGKVLKQFVFTYDYFPASGEVVSNAHNQLRLKLLSIKELSISDSSIANQYSFDYNETPLPPKNSLAQDHWGYPNNSSGVMRGNAIADLSCLRGMYYNDEDYHRINGAPFPKYNPAHNEAFCSSGLLKTVHYPDGGKTVFTFESNSFWGRRIDPLGSSDIPQYTEKIITDRNSSSDTRSDFIQATAPVYISVKYDLNRGINSWSDMYGSKISIPYTTCAGCRPETVLNFDSICYDLFSSGNMTSSIKGELIIERPAGVTTFSVDIPNSLGDQNGANLNHAYLSVTFSWSTTPPADYSTEGVSRGGGMRIKEIHHYENGSSNAKSIRRYSYDDPLTSHTSGILFDYPHYFERFERVGYSLEPKGHTLLEPLAETPRQFYMSDRPLDNNPYGWNSGVGYGYVKETIDGIGGYTEYRFNNVREHDTDHSYRVGIPENGKLLAKTVVNSTGQVVQREQNEYTTHYSKFAYGVNLHNTWNKFPGLINPQGGEWIYSKYLPYFPAYYSGFHIILKYALNQCDVVLTNKTQILDNVKKETTFTYDFATLLPKTEKTKNSDGNILEKHVTYPTDYTDIKYTSLVSKNIIDIPVETRVFVNGILVDGELIEYDELGKMDSIRYADINSSDLYPVADYTCLEKDSRGNPLGYRIGDTFEEVYVWGYNHRYPIAKITGVTYSEVLNALNVATLKSYSISNTPDISTLNGLRHLLPSAMIWTWTYNDLGSILTEITPDGVEKRFRYDGFNRMIEQGVMVQNENHVLDRYQYANDMISHITLWDSDGVISCKDISYSNGLGMVSQVLHTNYTKIGNTLVEGIEYDSALREISRTLPYPISNQAEGKQYNIPSVSSAYWSSLFPGEGNFRRKTTRENSPLGRITAEYKPGNVYYYADKGIKRGYRANRADEVLKLVFSEDGSITNTGKYVPNRLFVNEMTDEDGVKITEYRDLLDNLVLSRREISENSYADTYYVRDIRYNLRYVITPEGSSRITSPGLYEKNHVSLSQLSYIYEYDGKRRLVAKSNPGCGALYYVYDKAGRVVASQSANDQNSGTWRLFSLDGSSRLVMETHLSSNISRASLQASFSSLIGSGDRIQSFKYGGYSKNPLSVFLTVPGIISIPEVNFSIQGMLTEEELSEVDVENVSNPIHHMRYHFYDNLGREVQNVLLISGHVVRNSYKYDYRGNVIIAVEDIDGVIKKEVTSYDARGRKDSESTSIDETLAASMIVQYGYDDLGRSISKSFGNGVFEGFTYNLQGWRRNMSVSNNGVSLFHESLMYYDNPVATSRSYAGRITGREVVRYGLGTVDNYDYDKTGRLLGNHIEAIDYDLNSNIITLDRALPGKQRSRQQWSYEGNKRNGYIYDDDGNIISFPDGIIIMYNWLGLPSIIAKDGDTMHNIYLSDGTKIACLGANGNGFLYLGSRRYRKMSNSLSLESVSSSAGRITANEEGGLTANYYSVDHLGNIRLITSPTGDVVFESDYTPYGAVYFENGTSQGFDFAGKERQPVGDFLDFGARFYNPDFAIWNSPDCKSESFYELSPYSYCASNPLMYVDPDGNNPVVVGLVCGAVDFGVQIGVNMIKGDSFVGALRNVDYTSVIAAGVTGAISPSSVAKRIIGYTAVIADAAIDYSVNEGLTYVGGDKKHDKPTEEVFIDAISGAFGIDGGNAAAKGITNGLVEEASSKATATLPKDMKQTKSALAAFGKNEGTQAGISTTVASVTKMGGEAGKMTMDASKTQKDPLFLRFEQGQIVRNDPPYQYYFNPAH